LKTVDKPKEKSTLSVVKDTSKEKVSALELSDIQFNPVVCNSSFKVCVFALNCVCGVSETCFLEGTQNQYLFSEVYRVLAKAG
jgi:hypothetical protein